jgi:4-amino-4-deoxy-L-arabinose transferase-like glycosyltransferase
LKQQKAIFTSKAIDDLKTFLQEFYPLVSILVGYFLVAISIGPYQNGDTAWEYDAVLGILKTGLPVAYGVLMDQPPLGFYIQALFFNAFGVSINNGTFLVTLFGLGCVVLVYGIGKAFYNKTTGFFAALLFAFSPWHLILSRTFLIDTQCLFFSLFSLFVGIVAVRRDSFKLFIASGIVFAAAFNTKLYAVFTLIPLLMFFFYYQPRNLKRTLTWIAGFSIPVLIAAFLWYQVITGIGLSSIFLHADLISQNPNIATPTPFFVTNFLVSYGLGWFFIDASIVSLLVCLWQRRIFRKFLPLDAICVATIICIVSVNIILGTTLDLKAPFLNAIKYDYQALPFFSLLAASLVSKSFTLVKLSWLKTKIKKVSLIAIALLGFVLVAAALFYNMWFTHLFSTWDYLIFRVDPNINEGYSLFNSDPIGANNILMFAQLSGFMFAISGILWVNRHKLSSILNKIILKKALK